MPGDAPAVGRPTVTVCRGCCCGSVVKHPQVDHAAGLAALRSGAAGFARLRTSDCLGPCERADVVVVSPSTVGRRAGGRPVWLGFVDAEIACEIGVWLRAGGPGVAEPGDLIKCAQIPAGG